MRERGLTGSTSIDQQENVMCIEMFHLNTIEQLFLLVEQLDQLEVCLPYGRLEYQYWRYSKI